MAHGKALRLLVLTALAGCSVATLPLVTEADVQRAQRDAPEVTQASLERGRSLYQTRCSSCHEPYHPQTRDAAEWELALHEMADRARLKPADRRLVMDYLRTFADGEPTAAQP